MGLKLLQPCDTITDHHRCLPKCHSSTDRHLFPIKLYHPADSADSIAAMALRHDDVAAPLMFLPTFIYLCTPRLVLRVCVCVCVCMCVCVCTCVCVYVCVCVCVVCVCVYVCVCVWCVCVYVCVRVCVCVCVCGVCVS